MLVFVRLSVGRSSRISRSTSPIPRLGDPVPGQGDPNEQQGEGGKQAGKDGGEHELEVEFTLEELAEILGEQLELPRIEPRGQKTLKSKVDKYTAIATQGPNSLRHFKRTFKEALKRQIASGTYDPSNPVIVPIKKDMRYRSWKSDVQHENSAVIIYMMDVSGSMGDEQKEIVRTEAFWINTWLRSQYKGVETRYIIHDATAKEVDEETFFRTRESGGTLISSAYKLCEQMITTDYPPGDWNIYPFHFSDGDNWSTEDTKSCIELLKTSLLSKVNVFCYGQVDSRYGSGQFYKDLNEAFGKADDQVRRRFAGLQRDSVSIFLKRFSRWFHRMPSMPLRPRRGSRSVIRIGVSG